MLGTRNIFVDASVCHVVLSMHYVSPRCFFDIFSASCHFASRVINFQLFELVLTPIHSHTAGGQTLRPAVILHPCWRPTSPLPTQRSSFTYPAGRQTLPSPPAVMAVKLSLLHPVVILHPCWLSNYPLPPRGHGGQIFFPHSGHGGQTLPSPPSGHGGQTHSSHPAVMAVNLSPSTQRSWQSNSPILPSGHGGQPFPSHPAVMAVKLLQELSLLCSLDLS